MIYTLDEIRSIITPIAKRYNLKAVWVFGSYARGDATETSDVDLVIDYTGCTVQGLDRIDLMEEIENAFENGADIVPDENLHMPTDLPGKRYFRRTVLKEMVKIYDSAA